VLSFKQEAVQCEVGAVLSPELVTVPCAEGGEMRALPASRVHL